MIVILTVLRLYTSSKDLCKVCLYQVFIVNVINSLLLSYHLELMYFQTNSSVYTLTYVTKCSSTQKYIHIERINCRMYVDYTFFVWISAIEANLLLMHIQLVCTSNRQVVTLFSTRVDSVLITCSSLSRVHMTHTILKEQEVPLGEFREIRKMVKRFSKIF